jgi:hypothetical protein
MATNDDETRRVVEAGQLMARYVHCVDAGEVDGAASLFAADARLEGLLGIPVIAGRDAIRDFFANYERDLDPSAPRGRHHLTSMHTRVDADGVLRSTSYLHMTGLPSVITGVYEDEFVEEGGELRFSLKRFRLESG